MFSKIIDYALHNQSLSLGIVFVLCVAGIFSALKLPVDAVPDITNVQAMVITRTGALDPEKVERTITYIIETELRGIPHVEEIRSISKYGLSQITIIFEENTNLLQARQQIGERLARVMSQMPEGISPELAPMITGLGEIYFYAVVPKKGSELEKKPEKERLIYLRTVQDFMIKPQLKKVKGIADVDTFGGYSKEIHINLEPVRLNEYGLTIEMVAARLNTLGENYGGGYIRKDGRQIVIRTLGRVTDLEQIRKVPIKRSFYGGPVKLGQIAAVVVSHPQPLGGATYNGEEAVLGMPMMLVNENSRNVSAAIAREIKNIDLPEDVEIKQLYSRDYLVNETIRTVSKNLLEGAAFVVIVLMLVLGNVRAAILVSLAIPVSMLIALIGMNYFRVSGNLMSLGAIDFGLLVDGSVVMFENLIRRVEDYIRKHGCTPSGKQKMDLILEATTEVIRPVVTALLIIMGVFIPLFALEGVEGKMFRPMAQTVLLAMAASLVIALVVMPVLGYMFLKCRKNRVEELTDSNENQDHHEPLFLRFVLKGYKPALQYSLDHPFHIILPTVFITVVALILFMRMGGEFIPQLNEGDMVINMTRNASSNFDVALDAIKKSEKIIQTFPEVENVYTRFGTPESATDPSGIFFGDTFVILKKDLSKWRKINGRMIAKKDLFREIKEKISQDQSIPSQELSVTQPIEMRFNEMLEGSRADVTMRLYGLDLDQLYTLSREAAKIIESLPGVESVQSDPLIALNKSPVMDIELDYNAISFYGLSLENVNELVEMAMSGHKIGNLYETSYRFPIVIKLDPKLRNDISQINQIPVGLDGGGSVALEKVANIEMREQVSTIARSQGQRYAALSIYLKGIDVQTFVKNAQTAIQTKLQLPEFYEVTWGGQFKNLERAKKRLALIVPLTLLGIFLLLLRYFNQYKQALLVFMGIPSAVIGGILTLSVLGINFSISAGVGFIALMGIAVLNSLVLVSYYDEQALAHPKKPLKQLIFEATVARFRPVIITTMVAGLGFLPMAMNSGLGSEVQKPLAIVVIGGLIIATLITVLLLPALYTLFIKKES